MDRITPKRCFASVLLFAVLGAGGIGFAGMAAAGSEDDPSLQPGSGEAQFRLAAPRSGDAGTYTFGFGVDGSAGGRIDFAVRDDATFRTVSGEAQRANAVRMRQTWDGTSSPLVELYLVPGTTSAYGQALHHNKTDTTPDGRAYAYEYRSELAFATATELPCAFRSALQGHAVALRPGATIGSSACPGLGDVWLQPTGFRVQDGRRLLRADIVAAFCSCAQGNVTFDEAVPYPIEVRHGDAAGTLTHFSRGAGAVVTDLPERVPARDVQGLRMATLPRDGLDETGIEHPFPWSAAYEVARSHGDGAALAEFLERHPDAYVQYALYQEYDDPPSGKRRGWTFQVVGGGEAMAGSVTLHPVPDDPLDPVIALLPQRPPTHPAPDPYEVTVQEPVAHDRTFQLSALPRLPTLASMAARWGTYGPDAPLNGWGYSISCQEDCSKPRLDVWVGNRTLALGDGVQVGRHDTLSWTLQPSAEGQVEALDRQVMTTYDWEDVADAPAQEGAGEVPAGFGAPRETLAAGAWSMPGGRAATNVGLASAAAGLAYLLWPVAKAGALGLFSRVRGSQLLDNETRRTILQLVEAEPGIHHAELVRRLARGNGTAEHHLRKLLTEGLVRRVQGTRYVCYFPAGTPPSAMAGAPILKSPVAQQVLQLARSEPGIEGVEMARRIGVTPTTVSYHLVRLRQAGLVA